MRRKLGAIVGLFALTYLLSSCFALNGFILIDYTLHPGQVTTARFTLRPTNWENVNNPPEFRGPQYEFVVLGVTTDGGLTPTKATWGTNGTFGGPTAMAVNGALLTQVLNQPCGNQGLDIAEITNTTWKAFVTPNKVGDGNKFEQKALVDVKVKAKATATPGDEWEVIGVAGQWFDDGDDTPENGGGDIYVCHGIGTSRAHIIPA